MAPLSKPTLLRNLTILAALLLGVCGATFGGATPSRLAEPERPTRHEVDHGDAEASDHDHTASGTAGDGAVRDPVASPAGEQATVTEGEGEDDREEGPGAGLVASGPFGVSAGSDALRRGRDADAARWSRRGRHAARAPPRAG